VTFHRHRVGHRDGGLAIAEFLVVVVALAVPIGYGALAVERLHAASVTAQSAAAGAALAVARGIVPAGAADRVVSGYWQEASLRQPVRTTVRCRPSPCPTPGGTVTVSVETDMPLPMLPPGWGAVPVQVQRSQAVDRFASAAGR
jgi:hypothetical protein